MEQIKKEQIKAIFIHHKGVSELLVAADGNVFIPTTAGKNLCKDHCNRNKIKFETVLRSDYVEGAEDTTDVVVSKSSEKGTDENPSEDASWKDLPWQKIVEFAESKGFKPETKMNKGKAALIVEVKAFFATQEIGGSDITNHNNTGE